MAKYTDEEWQEHAEDSLWELMHGAVVEQEKVDRDGVIHNLRSKLPPNMDAVKFALKNRSKGRWADKTEVTHTQINFNLNASYKEVKDLMAKEKAEIQHASQNYIDVKPVNEG